MSLEEAATATTTTTTTTVPRVSLSDVDRVESEVDHQHCLVCYSDLTHPGILPCNHNEICGVCHLRLRHLHGNKKCPICKEEHEKIVADVPGKQFDEYPMWGDELGSNYVYRANVGMFFPTNYYETDIEPLFGYQCTEKGCSYDGTVPDRIADEEEQQQELETGEATNGEGNNNKRKKKKKKPPTPLRSLQDHLRVKHRLTLCQLCIDHKRDFVASLPRMAPYQLKKHLTKGDGPGSGFEGHPVCEFCRPKRFYDLTHLHMHLQKEHYKCHVCEKQGNPNQYFRNYQNLEKHFDRAHFLCHDVQCLQARFVVFENEIDLHAHERQVHGGTSSGSSKIQLEFRTRRTGYDGQGVQQRQEVPSEEDFNYGLQGEAFVPAALPQTDDLTLHPMHLRRTAELRAQAAQIREQQELQNQGASFPTLQAATAGTETEAGAGQQPLNIGWASGTTVRRVAGPKRNAGQVTESDFPALPSSGPPRSAATAKIRTGGGPAPNRQFAAMQATAAQHVASRAPASDGGWGASRPAGSMAAAPQAASYQYDSSAFPPTAPPPVNRQENLAPDNFPSLGGGKKKAAPKYPAATNLAKKFQNAQPAPSWNSAIDFPGPSVASSSATKKSAAQVKPAPRQTVPSLNNEVDFPTPGSFPALGGGGKKKATSKLSVPKKHLSPQPPPSWNNALEFPGPPVAGGHAPKKGPAPVEAAPRQNAPVLNSAMDFPAPPSASNTNTMKQRVVKNQKQPSQAAKANVLRAPQTAVRAPENPQETLQEMQASLGPAKYKKLKKFTREFAQDDLAPDSYIDHAASLFDRGYGDPDFWKTIPALVSSCPNQASANKALQYMESLRSIKAPPAVVAPALTHQPAPAGNSWGTGPLDLKPESFPTPAVSSARAAGPSHANASVRGAPNTRYVVPGGKKKNAWGGGAAPTVTQPKKTPGSVSAAAANQNPQGGSATKFMAQHTKQQAQQQQQKGSQNSKKKGKKKEKDELRNLAFGR